MSYSRAATLRAASGRAESAFGLERLESRQLLSTVYWDGGPAGTGTNWHDPVNWSAGMPSGGADVLPGSADDAVLSVAANPTITITQNVTVQSILSDEAIQFSNGTLSVAAPSQFHAAFSMSGATTLTGTGDVTITGTLSYTGGRMEGTGHTILAAGATGNFAGSGTLVLARTLDNSGTINVTAPQVGGLNAPAYTFNNLVGGVVNSSAAATLFNQNNGVSVFNNFGTFNRTGAGGTTFAIGFNNSGALSVQGGGLALSGGGSSTTSILVPAAGTLIFGNNYTPAAGTALDAAGTVIFQAGTQNFAGTLISTGAVSFTGGVQTFAAGQFQASGAVTISAGGITINNDFAPSSFTGIGAADLTLNASHTFVNLSMTNHLTGSGDVTITGTLSYTGGRMEGTGHTILAAGATGNFAGSGTLVLARTLDNSGTINITAPQVGGLNAPAYTFNNLVGGVVNSSAAATLFNQNNGVSVFNNAGTFNRIGPGGTTFAIGFNNSGTLSVQGGGLALSGGGSSTTSILVPAAGTLIFGNNYTLSSATAIDAAGTVIFQAGAQVFTGSFISSGAVSFTGGVQTFAAGQFQASGAVTITAGAITINNDFAPSSFTGIGAADLMLNASHTFVNLSMTNHLTGTGDVTITGTLSYSGGRMEGAGRTILAPGATGNFGGSGTLVLARTLDNSGTVNITAPQIGGLNAPAYTFNNLVGGVVNSSAAATLFNQNNGVSVFNNFGTFNRTGAGGTTFAIGFNNSGALSVLGGALQLNFTLSSTGSAFISGLPGGTLIVNTSLAGSTSNGVLYAPRGIVQFTGGGRQLEVMSSDLGNVPAGFTHNFVYSTVSLAAGASVTLVNQSDNAPGPGNEALYVNTLIVPAGASLNLAGFHVYARATQIIGSVTNGVVSVLSDSGPIVLDSPTPGQIQSPAEVDQWTFFGRAGHGVTVSVNPGSSAAPPVPLPPPLNWAEVQVVAPDGSVLATANNVGGAAGSVVSLLGVHLPTDGTYRIRVLAPIAQPSSTGRYVLTAFDATLDFAPLVLGQQLNGAIETPYAIDRWTFSATAGQQVQFHLVNAAYPGIAVTLTGPDGFTAFTDITADSGLIDLPSNGGYVLAVRAIGGGFGNYAFRLNQTTLVNLPLGTTYSGTLAGSGQAQLFRVTVPIAKPLSVDLNDSTDADRNEVYIRFGLPPTRGEYNYRYDAASSADQTLLAPIAAPGDWYILVYSTSVPTASAFTLRANAADIRLAGVTPDHYSTNNLATLTLTGAGFTSGTQVMLLRGLDAIVASPVEIDNFTQITADFSLVGAAQGAWSVRVVHPGGDIDTLDNAFTVTAGGTAHLETHLVLPSVLGRHAVATMYVEYANTGDAAMPAPLLRLQSADPDNSDRPILTLDQSRIAQGLWGYTGSLPDGYSNSVQILASGAIPGVLNPGERIQVPVYYVGLQQPWDVGDQRVEMELRIFDTSNTDAVPWNDLREGLRPFTIQPDAWNAIYGNIVTNVGPDWGSFVRMLSGNASYLGRLGDTVKDVGVLWNFEVQQAIGFSPIQTLASSVDASIPTPGDDLAFGRTYALSLDQRFNTSLFGRGWSAPWQTHLSVDADGTVNIIGDAGTRSRFQPDSRSGNAFFGLAGETGTLSRVSPGIYEVREPDGSMMRFNAQGQIDFSEDANGNRVTAAYASGRLTSLTHSSGASLTIAYNPAGLIASITDSAARTATFGYDPTNQYLTMVTEPDGLVSRYTYDTTAGSPRQHSLLSVQSHGVTRYFTYDVEGRLSGTFTTGNTAPIAFGYDSAGRVDATDAGSGTTSFYFDHNGLLGRVIDPLGNITTARYDQDLRLRQLIDPIGQSQTLSWTASGALSAVTDRLGHTASLGYSAVGPNGTIERATSFTDASGNVTRYTYDAHGNLLSTVYPSQSVERIGGYDPAGDPLSFVNRRGQTLGYTYNAAGQVTRQTFQDSTFIDFTYDARGNLRTATQPGNLVTVFDYNASDRLTRVTYPNGRHLDFIIDSFGRRRRMTDQDGSIVNYDYDTAGRLQRLSDGADTLIVQYAYDAVGRLSRKDNGNGTYTTYAYDLAGQVLSIVNQALVGTVNSRFDYTYDALGRRRTMTTIDGAWTFDYDGNGQLTHAVFDSVNPLIPHQDLRYVYEAAGNRIRTIENGVTTEYTTNNLNQYTQVGGDVLVYDADGNLVSRSGPSGNATYTYDQQGHLTRVVTPDGTWEYQYDAFGNRIAGTLNGQRTEYLLDPSGLVSVVGEYTSAGALIARYVYGEGLVARIDGAAGTPAFYDFDAIGSTSDLTGPAGQVLNRYVYKPFGGSLLATGATANLFQFVGQFGVANAGNGLQFMRARFYDPVAARFVSPDPSRIAGGANLYEYGANQPTSNIDPRGLDITITIPTPRPRLRCFLSYGYGGHGAGFALGTVINPLLGPAASAAAADFGADLADKDCPKDPPTPTPPPPPPTDPKPKPKPQKPPQPPIPPSPPPGPGGGGGGGAVATPMDPNHFLGPSGFDSPNFLRADALLPYRIEFENYGPGSLNDDGTPAPPERWATAPAQRVEINTELNPLLDLGTLRLTGFGFGDFNISIAPTQSFQQVLTMTYNGRTFEVWFDASLDFATRALRVVYQSIDPATSLPPDVLTGFLPPEDGTGRGRGFVTYTVQANAGLPTGAAIRSVALISFDEQTFIATNQVDPLIPSQGTDPAKEALVTVDAGLPTSSVHMLPAGVTSGRIPVSWSGVDDPGGSGVGAYDVYVSINSADFVPWLIRTTLTSAVYNASAAPGASYAFYSIAIDNVGNTELPPPAPDTVTTFGTPGAISFDNDAGDFAFGNPINWSGNSLPTAADNVIISLPDYAPVTLASGTFTVATLIIDHPLTISGGTLSITGLSWFNAGVTLMGGTLNLAAASTLTGTLTNAGTLWLASTAALAITGDYVQSATGTLHTDIASASTYGRLNATGSATLDGALSASFVSGYAQARSDSFDFVTASSRTGAFAALTLPGANPANTLKPIVLYTPAGARILITSTADFNDDGIVNSQDFFDFLNVLFSNPFDFNHDGLANSQDFFDYLNVFFLG